MLHEIFFFPIYSVDNDGNGSVACDVASGSEAIHRNI